MHVSSAADASLPCASQEGAGAAWLPRLRGAALAAFLRAYPWLHAGQEAARFAYQLAYLLDSTPYYSPALHLLRQRAARVSGHELARRPRRARAAPCCALSAPLVPFLQAGGRGDPVAGCAALDTGPGTPCVWPLLCTGASGSSAGRLCPQFGGAWRGQARSRRSAPRLRHRHAVARHALAREAVRLGDAQVAAERTTRARRGTELARARARGPLPARLLREGALRAGYALADHTRNALILSVFAFKARRPWRPCCRLSIAPDGMCTRHDAGCESA